VRAEARSMRQLVQPRRQRFELSVLCDGKLQDSWALGGGGRHIAVHPRSNVIIIGGWRGCVGVEAGALGLLCVPRAP
jgi:hypothetical protein